MPAVRIPTATKSARKTRDAAGTTIKRNAWDQVSPMTQHQIRILQVTKGNGYANCHIHRLWEYQFEYTIWLLL